MFKKIPTLQLVFLLLKNNLKLGVLNFTSNSFLKYYTKGFPAWFPLVKCEQKSKFDIKIICSYCDF